MEIASVVLITLVVSSFVVVAAVSAGYLAYRVLQTSAKVDAVLTEEPVNPLAPLYLVSLLGNVFLGVSVLAEKERADASVKFAESAKEELNKQGAFVSSLMAERDAAKRDTVRANAARDKLQADIEKGDYIKK